MRVVSNTYIESKNLILNRYIHCSVLSTGLCLAVGALSLGASDRAAAQAKGGVLEEIVVTVRRRSEMASDVPMAIQVMTPDFIEDQGITTVDKLNETVPGMNITTAGSGTSLPLISLRGQRPSEVLITMDPAVPIYYADVVLTPVNGSNMAFYDLANIQVLKGPQGTLFGRNSTGGAVLVTPQAPETEFGGYAKGALGNYDLYKFEGAVNLPVNDVLGFRIAGHKTTRDGYQSIVDNGIPEGEVGSTASRACDDCLWDEDSEGIRVSMSIDSGDFRNMTTMSYDTAESAGKAQVATMFNPGATLGGLYNFIFNGGLAAFGGPSSPLLDESIDRSKNRSVHDVETDLDSYEKTVNMIATNATEFDINDDLTVKNIIGYRRLKTNNTIDGDGTALPLFGAISVDSPTVPDDVKVPSERELLGEQWSNELQFFGSGLDGRLEWLVGLYYYKMRGSEDFLSANVGRNLEFDGLAAPFSAIEPLFAVAQNGFYNSPGKVDTVNTAYAIFSENTYEINDELSFTLGLRQTWDKRELTGKNIATSIMTADSPPSCIVLDENNNPLPECSRTEDESYSSPTWRVALNYSPEYGKMMYASIATGYRTGGFQTRVSSNLTFTPFDEETVTNYELGHKADWKLGFLGNVRTSIALYYQDYDDIQKTQAFDTPEGIVTVIENAGSAVIQGVDADVIISPTEQLTLTLGYAYIDAYYKEWQTPTFDNKDSPFVFIPEHSVFANTNYTFPLDPSIGVITFTAGVYYQSKVDSYQQIQHVNALITDPDIAAEFKQDQVLKSYSLWNFRLAWDGVMGSNFDVAAYINNAFDKEYAVGATPIVDSLGLNIKSYGPPRTFGASAKWRF